MTEYRIFCDLDGVLVDFNQGYKDLTGIELDKDEHRNDSQFWAPIEKAGYDFWVNLKWIEPDGHILWEHISKYNPTFICTIKTS